jgi:hypothetical protein
MGQLARQRLFDENIATATRTTYFDVPERSGPSTGRPDSKGQFINWVIKPNYRYSKRIHH